MPRSGERKSESKFRSSAFFAVEVPQLRVKQLPAAKYCHRHHRKRLQRPVEATLAVVLVQALVLAQVRVPAQVLVREQAQVQALVQEWALALV